jgi:hypothetical protein
MKMVERFTRRVDGCGKEDVIKGTISGFETVPPVPRSRLTKGIILDTEEGTIHVGFTLRREGRPILDASPLETGDEVVVIGGTHPETDRTILPVLILCPEKRLVSYAREQGKMQWGDWGDREQLVASVIIVLGTVLGGASILWGWVTSPGMYPEMSTGFLPFFVIALAALLILMGIDVYRRHMRRPRVFRYDENQWLLVAEEMMNRFDIDLTGMPAEAGV